MTDRSGAVRALAVEALGRVGGDAAVEDLKAAAADPEFHVRATANVALATLGDTQAAAVVTGMLASPVADIQLLAARAFAGRGPGPWIDAILPLLGSNEGLVTLRAAELLAPFRPDAVRSALNGSAESTNPVVRSEAVRVMATAAVAGAGAADLAALRRALRDPEAPVRLHAASAILAVGGSRK
jgi:HEAT repeat protein